jgi:peptide/nickel transport system permease protein
MSRLILRRLALGMVTLLVVSVLVFLATQALPGDTARAILGRTATPERLAALREQLHLDRPLIEQYLSWLGGVVVGNLGHSLADQQPVASMLAGRVANSTVLLLVAAAVSIPLSLGIGIASAIRRDSPLDHAWGAASLVLAALPEFVVGTVLILFFATAVFHVLPPVSLVPPGSGAFARPAVIVLPALTLALAVAPYISRIVRASMIEVLQSDYIEMARLKGLAERDVILRHAMPNAIVPAIHVIALQLAYLAGGVVVVEYLFSYPGIGSALVDAVANRDVPVVQALVLLIAAVYVVVNLLADVATILVTPRLRTAGR